MTALISVLLASLAGSVHCAGMCGPFVCVYAGLATGHGRGWLHVAYHGGRLASYMTLGAFAGALGAGANALGGLLGVSRAAALLAGVLMVWWGTHTILAARGVVLWRRTGHTLRSPLGAVLQRLRGRPPVIRAGATGLLTTLLPCGWLYAFVAVAAGSGSAPAGIATMAVFWLGTLPALTAVGALTQRLAGRYGRRLPVVMASLVVALGILTIAGRLGVVPPLPLSSAHDGHSH